MKNECLKTRPASNPYEIWKNHSGWTWKILKKYQADDNKPFGRWFCSVSSPFTRGGEELGDVYAKEIKSQAFKVS